MTNTAKAGFRPQHCLQNHSGQALILVAVAMASVMLTISILAYDQSTFTDLDRQKATVEDTLQNYKDAILSSLINLKARDYIGNAESETGVRANPNIWFCMTDATFDCPAGEHPLIVYTSAGTPFIGTENREGITVSNLINPSNNTVADHRCFTFRQTNNGVNCPVKYRVFWKPECPTNGMPCNLPLIKVFAILEKDSAIQNPITQILVNLERFNIEQDYN